MARLGVSKVAGPDGIANNIKYSFYVGAAVSWPPSLVTVLFSKEYGPADYERIMASRMPPQKKRDWVK